jgi:3-oxoacyl-[acyl-carrier-protein] synthase II
MKPRAVFTGMSVLSPIGQTLDTFWQSLELGRSGIKPISTFDPSGAAITFAGEIPEFDAKKTVAKEHRKALKMMGRPIQMAVAIAPLALKDSGVDLAKVDLTRFGCEFGAGLIASELEELGPASQIAANCIPGAVDLLKWGEAGLPVVQPLWMLKYLPNMLACHVSIIHNAQGPNNTITETDVGSLLALGEALRIIQRGQADLMLAGGADSRMNPLSMTRLSMFATLSRGSEPTKASRPFDQKRDGLVPAEGGAVLVLEEREHAEKRGARIYGELAGFGASFDLKRDGTGLARAIRAALKEAQVNLDQIDHVNAHGYSTPVEDRWEARGIASVFGPDGIPVLATKSMTGNLGAGGSLVEIAASLLAMSKGTLPPSINYEFRDPECPVAIVTHARPVTKDCFVKVSITEKGQCAAAVIRRAS